LRRSSEIRNDFVRPPVNRPAGIPVAHRCSDFFVAEENVIRSNSFAIIAIAMLTTGTASAQDTVPICHAPAVNDERGYATDPARADAAGVFFCLYQGPMTVHLEVHQTSIAAILSALSGAYKISYRSSIPLTETRSGRYAGRVQSVIADVLYGYDYVIRHKNSNIDVIVFDKSAGQPLPAAQAMPTPVAIEANQTAEVATDVRRPRGEATVSRLH
jgi:hypothetical protein